MELCIRVAAPPSASQEGGAARATPPFQSGSRLTALLNRSGADHVGTDGVIDLCPGL